MATAMTCGIADPFVVRFTQNPAGTGVTSDYTMIRAGLVVDTWCVALAASALGTVSVRNTADPVTPAGQELVCAVANTIGRATQLDNDHTTFAVGNIMRFVTAGAATVQPDVFVLLVPAVAYSSTV